MTQILNEQKWSLAKVWNEVFDKVPRQIIPRDYLYASEVGSSFADVFLKMRGVQYTNYPTSVASMKMEAGKVWESIVRMVLKRAGLLRSSQERVNVQLPGLLPVHGKLDFIAGGFIDLSQIADFSISLKLLWQELDMPEIYQEIADRQLQDVRNALDLADNVVVFVKEVLEVKSVSQYVWQMIEATGVALPYHVSQIFHYSKGLNRPFGRIIYINRDDCRIMEKQVWNNAENLANYTKWITTMTDYWVSQEQPPKESPISFNPIDYKFRKRTMEIEWSPYLTLLYGFKSPQEYRDLVDKPVKSFNRVFKRCVDAAKMTPGNMDIIKEAKVFFPEWDDMVDRAKAAGVVITEDPESE